MGLQYLKHSDRRLTWSWFLVFGLLCHHTASQRKWCAAVGLEDDVARLVAIHAQDTSQLSELRVTILQCPGSLYIMPGSNLVCFRSFVNVQLSAGNARTISFLFLSPCSSRTNYSRSGYRWCAIIRKPASAWLEGSRNGPRTSRQTHIHVVKIKEKYSKTHIQPEKQRTCMKNTHM